METSDERKNCENEKIEAGDCREFDCSGFVAEQWNNTPMKKRFKPMKVALHQQGTVFEIEKELENSNWIENDEKRRNVGECLRLIPRRPEYNSRQ
jgi:hypothetical protein